MTPETALEAHIERYRRMMGKDRWQLARVGIRRQHPSATVIEVEQMLKQRLELARTP